MKNIHKVVISAFLIAFLSNTAFAGKWINWGTIVEDVQDSIVSAVDFVCDKVSGKQAKVVASGAVITKEVSLQKIEIIDVTGAGTLVVTQDETQDGTLVIETDQALMPYVETKIIGNKLILKVRENTSFNVRKNDLIYRVRVKNVTNITLSGAIQAELSSIKGESLLFDLTGASRLSGDIMVESLIVESAGASRVTLSGKATVQNFDCSGSCKLDARHLKGKSAVVHVSGATTVYCNASDTLSGHVSGVSSLYYANRPVLSVKSSGVASVSKL